MIWKNPLNLEVLNKTGDNTLVEHLGIEFIEIGEDYLTARMPVDHRTKQPMGLLHGGASAALAETMGSVASVCCIDFGKKSVVGVEINANHLKSVKTGFVYGKVSPIKLGNRLHVWQIDICNEDEQLVCSSRLTVMIIDIKG